MASFKGEYENAIDNKGRVCLPARLRKIVNPEFQDKYTILIGKESCLSLYPQDNWKIFEKGISRLNPANKFAGKLKRRIMRNSVDIVLDNQNRIALSPKQMAHAGLNDKAIFIGCNDHIEIWSPEYLAKEDEEFTDEMFAETFEKILGADVFLPDEQ
ncbi:MAG: division/cell wall cluster transcriptional repressor MraZ [Candidatus Cyclonatronum sp.]|uniref:division/cell wall cluster transcriptional repressor MraZ n=1 Tax=Cyclonatronum sp. TaxID=3024185 RepID=UPI0025BE8B24|nr:division/cell wall cluster transcriptional repressor MraZ [Cyclonatronum sp.]MCC5934181.1 division/cell wall cluster transcriptional repressor MraZ [Balneolales bacterium]MCH8486354.1 division/cell wall cluster transcriptional repressor MraZ [Cyclonatronum sp.]